MDSRYRNQTAFGRMQYLPLRHQQSQHYREPLHGIPRFYNPHQRGMLYHPQTFTRQPGGGGSVFTRNVSAAAASRHNAPYNRNRNHVPPLMSFHPVPPAIRSMYPVPSPFSTYDMPRNRVRLNMQHHSADRDGAWQSNFPSVLFIYYLPVG